MLYSKSELLKEFLHQHLDVNTDQPTEVRESTPPGADVGTETPVVLDREAFLKKYKTKVPELYGAVMKEYAEVPDALLKKTKELQKYFDLSYAYVSSLKPKATKRKAAAKKR